MRKHFIKVLANTDIAAVAGGEAVNNFLDTQPVFSNPQPALPNLQPMFSTEKKELLIHPTLYFSTSIEPCELGQIGNFTLPSQE